MAEVYRFGDFVVDVDAYELRRAGRVVKLERLPMDALIRLVRAGGALVTRPDLRAALWPADVFIDEDAAINTLIRKIRRALGDDPAAPQFVDTVVGKGYRFLATMETTADEAAADPPAALPPEVARPSWPRAAVAMAAAGGLVSVAVSVAAGVWGPRGGDAREPAIASSVQPAQPVLPAAYDAYLRGRYAWNKRTEPDLRSAVRLFQASLDLDPTYALAYVGLSDAYAQLGYGSYDRPEDTFPLAREAARRAIDLNPSLPDACAALGYAVMYYDWDFTHARAQFDRAIALAPDQSLAHQWRAYLLTASGRPLVEAEREIAEARRLDPLSVAINTDRAYILHYYGRQDEATRAAQTALQMRPEFPLASFWLGRIYTQQGRYDDARTAFGRLGPLRTWTPAMAALGYLEGRAGNADAAQQILGEFDALTRDGRYASSYAMAIVHAGLGDRDRVFSLLDTAVRERSHWLVWLKRDPRWDTVRDDPRFAALLERVGLP